MLDKFLKEVVVIIVGKQFENIADLLNSKNHVNEFLIAKKMDLTINQTRNLLYKIYDQGLVSSIRKKDKKKGWYTYFWKIEVLKALEFLKSIFVKRIDHINNQLKSRETKQFYVCERCNIELNEETALNYNFTCNECGDVFAIKDNTKILRELNRNKIKFSRELDLINLEIQKELEKLEKQKIRELKKEAKKKAAKRKANKKAKKKAVKKKRKAVKKKLVRKKVAKKKVVKKAKKKIVKKKKSLIKKILGKKKKGVKRKK